VNIGRLMAQTQAALAGTLGLASTEARIEAQALLMRALGDVSRAWLLAHEHDPVAPEQQAAFESLWTRRLAGEPVAYILGEREFYGLTFKISPATLIPRPDTELLVELALQRCGRVAAPSPGTHRPPPCGGIPPHEPYRVLDLGTGSGAIALAIAHACPAAEVLASDASHTALKVARENAQRLGIANAAFVQSDWFAALGAQRFDLIVSNPPYIAVGDPHLQCGDVRFEPLSALASGDDGLHDIRCIVTRAQAYLQPGGWLLLEHGYTQAAQVRELLRQAGFGEVFSAPDLAGIERVSGGRIFSLPGRPAPLEFPS